jgi:hypothetical protein
MLDVFRFPTAWSTATAARPRARTDGTYTSAIEAVETWSTTLQGEGAEGAIVVIEEAFGTVVARYPLDSSGPPFDHGHVDRPPGGR